MCLNSLGKSELFSVFFCEITANYQILAVVIKIAILSWAHTETIVHLKETSDQKPNGSILKLILWLKNQKASSVSLYLRPSSENFYFTALFFTYKKIFSVFLFNYNFTTFPASSQLVASSRVCEKVFSYPFSVHFVYTSVTLFASCLQVHVIQILQKL